MVPITNTAMKTVRNRPLDSTLQVKDQRPGNETLSARLGTYSLPAGASTKMVDSVRERLDEVNLARAGMKTKSRPQKQGRQSG